MSRLGVILFPQHSKCNHLCTAHLRRHIATIYGRLRSGVLRRINRLQLARQMHV